MVLVTGATGFLGSYLLIELLENNQHVTAIFRDEKSIYKTKSLFFALNKETLFDKICWIAADILDIPSLENAFQKIEIVYHCAALVSFDPKDENLLRKINIEGTANIVNLCLAFNIKKMCYVSSIAALGDVRNGEKTITEATEWNAELEHSDYAISKYGGEIEVWRGQQEGLNVIVINPGVILGISTNRNHGSGKIFKTVAEKNNFYTKGTSGFVAVTDVAKIMVLLMNGNTNNHKYIVVAENITFRDLLFEIAKNLEVKRPKFSAGSTLLEFVWRLDWLVSKLFFTERKLSKTMANSLQSTDLYDNQKIKKELQYEFESISETIQKASTLYKKNKH